MNWTQHRSYLFRALLILVVAFSFGTLWVNAQTGTFTWSGPQNVNVTQWGTTAITTAVAMNDAMANPTAPAMVAHHAFWNTAVWQRAIGAALATFPTAQTSTARNAIGVGVVEKSSRWGNFSNPAAGSQGTVSWAAEAAVRHVIDCVGWSASATTAPALTALSIQLRDGATGAGTVLQQWSVAIPASTGTLVAPFSVCGLGLVMTTNTAATLEWSAALANLSQSVSMTGYNVN